MSPEEEAASAAILILRTIVHVDDPGQCFLVEEDDRPPDIADCTAIAQRIAMMSPPVALHGSLVRGTLGIRASRPSEEMMQFLQMRMAKSRGTTEFFGAVPRRCLQLGNYIQLIGKGALTLSAEGWIRLQTSYAISPEYSLAGDEPERLADGAPICWTIRVRRGGVGIA